MDTVPFVKEKGLRLRFVVGTLHGPWSGTWVVWANQGKGDIYVAARSVASQIKVSLHQSGQCRMALTREHLRRPNPLLGPSDRGAIVWEMRENLGMPGVSRPLAINFPGTELRPDVPPPKKAPVVFITPPPAARLVEVSIVFTSPTARSDPWPGAIRSQTALVAVFDLDALGKAWIVSREVDITPEHREQYELGRVALARDLPPREAVATGEEGVYRGLFVSNLENDTRFITELVLPHA